MHATPPSRRSLMHAGINATVFSINSVQFVKVFCQICSRVILITFACHLRLRWHANVIDTGTKTYNCPFNRFTQNNLHSATHLKCFQKEIPQTLAFIMADRDSRNGIISNQNFWQKKLWQITIDSKVFYLQSFLPYSGPAKQDMYT